MLRTYEGNEATPFSLLLGEDVRMWHSASFEFFTPYFLICHAKKNGSTWTKDTCLLWGQTNVVDFCNLVNTDPDRRITQFSILIPSNNSEHWHMEELEEIWEEAPSKKFRPLVFVGREGKLFRNGSQLANSDFCAKSERIYSRLQQ